MEIFLCEEDHPKLEPVTCSSVLGTLPFKTIIFKKRVRKVIIEVSERKIKCVGNHLKV